MKTNEKKTYLNAIKIISIFSFLLFYSCGQKVNTNNENGETATNFHYKIKKENEKLERIQTLNFILKKFGASDTFIHANYDMTYQYQNLLQKNDRIVIENFYISDIEKIDSIFKISLRYSSKMFIKFVCKLNQIENICPDFLGDKKIKYFIDDKFLILKINTIKKIEFKIDTYGENNGEDEPTTFIKLKVSDAFICNGEFVDIYLKPKR